MVNFIKLKMVCQAFFQYLQENLLLFFFVFSKNIIRNRQGLQTSFFIFRFLGILYFRFCKNMVDNKAPVFSHGCAFLHRLALNSFAFSASAAGGSSIHAIRDTAEMRAAASAYGRLRAKPTVCEHSTIYRLSPPFSHFETLTIPCQNDIIVRMLVCWRSSR